MTLHAFSSGRVIGKISGIGGPLTVLLHGWGRDRQDFRDLATRLPGTVIALDLPGFGSSPPPPTPWGSHDYADLVSAVIDEACNFTSVPRGAVLVFGHSFGGRVAVCLASARPVAALALAGTPLLRRAPSTPTTMFRLVKTLHKVGLVSTAHMERSRQAHGSADYRAAQGVMRSVLVRTVAESYERELASLCCPVQLIWGANDTAAPVAVAHEAAALIQSGCELLVIESAGHDVHLEQPDVVGRKLTALLSGVT